MNEKDIIILLQSLMLKFVKRTFLF